MYKIKSILSQNYKGNDKIKFYISTSYYTIIDIFKNITNSLREKTIKMRNLVTIHKKCLFILHMILIYLRILEIM